MIEIDEEDFQLQFPKYSNFLSGLNPMTNSRNCTCQQSSVNCRDQCVRMKGSMQNMSAGMYGFHMHVGSIVLQQGLAEC